MEILLPEKRFNPNYRHTVADNPTELTTLHTKHVTVLHFPLEKYNETILYSRLYYHPDKRAPHGLGKSSIGTAKGTP